MQFISPLYLLVLAFVIFLCPSNLILTVCISSILINYALLIYSKKFSFDSFRIYSRLKFLVFFLIIINAVFSEDHISGLIQGSLMSLQIVSLVVASYVVRTIAGAENFIKGLRQLKMPELLSFSIDGTLAIIEGEESFEKKGGGDGSGSGSGKGRSSGKGRNKNNKKVNYKEILTHIKNLDIEPLRKKIKKTLNESEQRASSLGLEPKMAKDVGIIAGIGAVMMSFKLVKVLPGVAIFSGAKAIFFFPLYFYAAANTHSRWGATIAGSVMGIIAFLNGDGRYGIFEIFKHIAPGLVIDILWPVLLKLPKKAWVYCIAGIVAAVARTSTELIIVALLGSSAELYLFPAMKLVPNITAGFLSGFVILLILNSSKEKKENNSKGNKGGNNKTTNKNCPESI